MCGQVEQCRMIVAVTTVMGNLPEATVLICFDMCSFKPKNILEAILLFSRYIEYTNAQAQLTIKLFILYEFLLNIF